MNKRKIDYRDYAGAIIKALQPGILVTTKAGDKIATAGLTPVDPEVISVPGLKEFPLTLECKVLLDQKQDDSRLPEELRDRFYRIQSNDHFCFYGEIVASDMIEP